MKIQKDKTNQADKLLLGSNAADKEFFDSSQKKEVPKPNSEKSPIAYVAIKEANNEAFYDFYDSKGEQLFSSMRRLKNECYPGSMAFNFYMKDRTLYYISKSEQSKLFDCENAIPLNNDLIAFKHSGIPYWGIANKTGKIILKNNRFGQIFGITSDLNVFCLISLDKAGIYNLKSQQINHTTIPYKALHWKIMMHPDTTFICVNSKLKFPSTKDINEQIKQIVTNNFLYLRNDSLFDFQDKRAVEYYYQTKFLFSDDHYIWNAKSYNSFNLKKKETMEFRPIKSRGDIYLVQYERGLMGLFNAKEGKELIGKKDKLFFIDSKHVAYQKKNLSVCLYNYMENSEQKYDTDYKLYSVAIVNGLLWIVTLHDMKDYCCYIFRLDGTEVLGDRLSQYRYFAPFGESSIIYARNQMLYTVQVDLTNDTRVEKPLQKGSQKYPDTTIILPKLNTFVVFYNKMWDLIDSDGKCLIENNKDFQVVGREDLETFINSDILVVQKKAGKGKDAPATYGAFNLEGNMIIPCEYDRIERW